MNLDAILEVEVPEDVSEVSSEQIREWQDLAEEVRGVFSSKPNYYKAVVEKADSDKRVRQAKRALKLKSKASSVRALLHDEIKNRQFNIDDRDRIRSSYVDDSDKLTYVDPERRLKIRIDVEDIEYRIQESLGKEIISDDMHGKDVHVESEVLAPDRVLIVAEDGARKTQIEVTGENTTFIDK